MEVEKVKEQTKVEADALQQKGVVEGGADKNVRRNGLCKYANQ